MSDLYLTPRVNLVWGGQTGRRECEESQSSTQRLGRTRAAPFLHTILILEPQAPLQSDLDLFIHLFNKHY